MTRFIRCEFLLLCTIVCVMTLCVVCYLCCCVCRVLLSGGYAGVRSDGLHIDSHRDCIHAPGLKHVMCASWGDDNLGEHRQ